MVFTLAFGSVGSALAARKVTKVVTGKIGASLRSSPEMSIDQASRPNRRMASAGSKPSL